MSFDPAAYLTKQGWKGKGTALRHGHATRPIAVVQKKTLSGIGKDRDEAVPFWDHIFASTASAILIPSLSPTPPAITESNSPNPSPIVEVGNSNSTAQTGPRKLSLLATAKRETARRGLYSRFSRGTTLSLEPTPEAEIEAFFPPASASCSKLGLRSADSASVPALVNQVSSQGKGKGRSAGNCGTEELSATDAKLASVETKAERRARRAARKSRREARALRKSNKSTTPSEVLFQDESGVAKKRSKKRLRSEDDVGTSKTKKSCNGEAGNGGGHSDVRSE